MRLTILTVGTAFDRQAVFPAGAQIRPNHAGLSGGRGGSGGAWRVINRQDVADSVSVVPKVGAWNPLRCSDRGCGLEQAPLLNAALDRRWCRERSGAIGTLRPRTGCLAGRGRSMRTLPARMRCGGWFHFRACCLIRGETQRHAVGDRGESVPAQRYAGFNQDVTVRLRCNIVAARRVRAARREAPSSHDRHNDRCANQRSCSHLPECHGNASIHRWTGTLRYK